MICAWIVAQAGTRSFDSVSGHGEELFDPQRHGTSINKRKKQNNMDRKVLGNLKQRFATNETGYKKLKPKEFPYNAAKNS